MTTIKTGIRIHLAGIALLCIMAGYIAPIHAKDLVVFEDKISLSAPDAQGISTISAPAGSVIVSPNAIGTFSIENSSSKETISGTVNPAGGFLGRIRAGAGDKIKITIMTTTEEKKRLKKKVPTPSTAPSSAQTHAMTRGPHRGPALHTADPTPEIIIRYKEAPGKSFTARAGRLLDPEAEVLDSGVLPPTTTRTKD